MDTAPPPRRHTVVPSPLGPLRVVVDADGALAGVYLPEHDPAPDGATLGPAAQDETLSTAAAAVLAVVTDPEAAAPLVLAQVPGTLFQHAVWAEVARIGVGRTRTYAEVAAAVGRPSAVRAVGAAVARNPRCLVVPCHRVVGADGAITSWAGGVDLKRWLLAREQRGLPAPVAAAPDLPTALDAPAAADPVGVTPA